MTRRTESAARRVEFTMPRLEKGHCVLTAYSAIAPAANLIGVDISARSQRCSWNFGFVHLLKRCTLLPHRQPLQDFEHGRQSQGNEGEPLAGGGAGRGAGLRDRAEWRRSDEQKRCSRRAGGSSGRSKRPRTETEGLRVQVFVGNLPPEAEARDLRDFFRDFGQINDAWVARKPPGFAFVWFEDERDAVLLTNSRPRPSARRPCAAKGELLRLRGTPARVPAGWKSGDTGSRALVRAARLQCVRAARLQPARSVACLCGPSPQVWTARSSERGQHENTTT
jgi:hypothetical protein